jgi:hypothetical protein
MITTNPLPLTTFSQVDYPIELENMFDYSGSQEFTKLTDTTATITNSASLPNIAIGEDLIITFAINSGSTLTLVEIEAEATTASTSGSTFEVLLTDAVYAEFPDGVNSVAYYKVGDSTPIDNTFGLTPTGGDTTFFKIRANSQGKGKVFIGEILRQYLPEFLAPKDYELDDIPANSVDVEILFNGQENNEIEVFYGSKYLDVNIGGAQSNNPLGQIPKLFQEQIMGYVTGGGERQFNREFAGDLSIGLNELDYDGFEAFVNLYPSIPCKNKIYLSSNYGLLADGELIDVSVPVLAFVNRAGQYEYIRFTGSNVNKYNVQEARLKQDYASTLTNADIGLIYEGIELTLADDNTNQGFAYRIDKLELQRCLALLMESPKAWLLVNGDLQQALEVRVKRESVVFASSFDKTYGNYTAQCEVIITQTLGQPQY